MQIEWTKDEFNRHVGRIGTRAVARVVTDGTTYYWAAYSGLWTADAGSSVTLEGGKAFATKAVEQIMTAEAV